jgi:oligopeptide transport system permease protein
MKLIWNLLNTVVVWFIVFLILVGIILLPVIQYEQRGYSVEVVTTLSWDNYKENIIQYYSNTIGEGSLGKSRLNTPVTEEAKRYFPRSLKIIMTSLLITYIFGILKGIYDYRTNKTILKMSGNGTTWFFQAIPDFFLILFVQMGILALFRAGFPNFALFGHDKWYSFILPSILLALIPICYVARVTSAVMASQEKFQYVQTAIAKGLTKKVVIYKHIFRNCWGGIFSHLSSVTIFLISNLLIVEYLMFYKGAAYRLYEALGFADADNVFVRQHHYETELVIGFLFVFMMIVLSMQIIGEIIKHFSQSERRAISK